MQKPIKLDVICTNCGLKNIKSQFDAISFEPNGDTFGIKNYSLKNGCNLIESTRIHFAEKGDKIFVEFDCKNRIKFSEQISPCGHICDKGVK